MVRQPRPGTGNDWELAPTPILVVDVFSGFTRRRDLTQKREFYMEVGIVVAGERFGALVDRRGQPV